MTKNITLALALTGCGDATYGKYEDSFKEVDESRVQVEVLSTQCDLIDLSYDSTLIISATHWTSNGLREPIGGWWEGENGNVLLQGCEANVEIVWLER